MRCWALVLGVLSGVVLCVALRRGCAGVVLWCGLRSVLGGCAGCDCVIGRAAGGLCWVVRWVAGVWCCVVCCAGWRGKACSKRGAVAVVGGCGGQLVARVMCVLLFPNGWGRCVCCLGGVGPCGRWVPVVSAAWRGLLRWEQQDNLPYLP
jgi:hypothetical protein